MLGLTVDKKKYMIGLISRLTDQKGLDLIDYVFERILDDNTQFVVIGTGEERYENMFRHLHGNMETGYRPISVMILIWLRNCMHLPMRF